MQLLVLQSSLRWSDSVTRRMTNAYVEEFRAAHSDASVIIRDLATSPIPHLPDELVAVQLGVGESDSPAAQLAEELISELEASDVILFGLPMYNFTVPSTVKAWIDHVVRARRTFTYDQNGPVGLLPKGKRAIAFVASGGAYGDSSPADFVTPYLRFVLAFVGITDFDVLRAEEQANPEKSEEIAAQAIQSARQITI